MINRPPQQQVYAHHLALSLIILFLTVYPYLFNNGNNCCLVAAYSSRDFELKHELIEIFDIIEREEVIISRPIFTRSTNEHNTQNLKNQDVDSNSTECEQINRRRISFSSLGQRYSLVLDQAPHLISKDFNIVALDKDGKRTNIPFNRNDLEILSGTVEGNAASKASVSISKKDQLITAQIKIDNDMVIVEPTYLHKHKLKNYFNSLDSTTHPNSKLYNETMIVYKLSDHKQFQPQLSESFCTVASTSNESPTVQLDDSQQKISPEIEDIFKYYKPPKRKIAKRGIEFFSDQNQRFKEKTRCTLHLVADYLFYKHVGNGDMQTTINYLLALINRVNQIYLPTKWETDDDRLESFSNIGFIVNNITIHQEFTSSSSGDIHYNMESDKIWAARKFLDNFSRHSPPEHYCLAHLLTYRQFDTKVLGLAYVASTRFGTIGGICSPTQQRGDAFYKHNTGVSTSKNIDGNSLITRQADLLLAHELGHNLGAEHDSNECRPAATQGGAYLMHPYAVMGFDKNNRFLSNCSRISIGRVIRRKASTCFVGVVDNVCGNGVVEGDEECDGGGVGHLHSDPCCDSSCHFTPGSQCSDRHSWCCSNCRIVAAGRPCRPAEEFNCKQASYCDGRSAKCPSAPPVEDNKVCVGRGLCIGGDCVPFCEARELHSCLCNNPADACKLCCKQSINSTCVPYNQESSYLPDGVLCYRGVCEKGRCEQPIQDVVERLWDVLEDINFTTFVKFLRDNIILVVLVVSIPLWCLVTSFINEFDKRIRQDVINTIMKHRKRRKPPPTQSPFLPRLFVGDENGSTNSLNDLRDDANLSLKHAFLYPDPTGASKSILPSSHNYGRGLAPVIGFQLPEGEEVVVGPRGSIALNSIELPHQKNGAQTNGQDEDKNQSYPSSLYSTQV